jgi:beta-xylosidase
MPSGFAWGWNVALRGDSEHGRHNSQTIDAVLDSGFNWVRFQLEWSQFERADDQWDPLPMDRKIDALNAAGVNILLVINKAPDWAIGGENGAFLRDYEEFAEVTSFVANRYAGKVQAYEIWNEQNLAHEVGGNVRVDDYFDLLEAGSRGVRAGDPNALVVFGGLTPNGINDPAIAIDDVQYLELMYQFRGGEISQLFDVMGAHVNSTHNPPDTMWPDNPSSESGWNDDDSFYFRRAEQLRQVMVDNGDEAKPMWLTEFGWTTENQAPGYEYGVNNSEEEVAEYLVRSYEICATEWEWCTGAFAWNLNWSTLAPPEDEKFPWSALNADWSPRPSYDALTALAKE